MQLSVLLPAYRPPPEHIGPTMSALRGQTLPVESWELVVIDNNSQPPISAELAAWHPQGRVVREERPGLVHARAAGIRASRGDVMVVVDQDNVLAPDFLATVLAIAREHPQLGTWGAGTISPVYERPELAPPVSLHALLTLRAATHTSISTHIHDNASTPWGAGLCLRRNVALAYLEELAANPLKARLDLCGDRRLSGGDTDICYTGCRMGFAKGVFPELRMQHLIPAGRCADSYLIRTATDRGFSEVLHELILTGRMATEPRGPWAFARQWWRTRGFSSLERRVHFAHRRGRFQAIEEIPLLK